MNAISQQTIFITGSTDGIGKLTALTLSKQRATVIIHGRNKEKVDNVVNELSVSASSKNIEGFTADLSSLNEVRQLARNVLERHQTIDVLINNAGVGFADGRLSRD